MWFSFGIAIVLISAATSMNTRQRYGEGWLDGECYIVKDGVYIGSAILVFVSIGLIIVSDIMTTRKNQVEEEYKVHSPFG
ncbi:Protein MODIFYING WALL LIGNIN-1 [Camellia lanceoleosa]|uniref:Protein MODIFYING WALL LIGNIN-1 n=1 Tax=Camellia lanceoleosa TaxID=1840588 RepID=A0ACC0FEM2_9ERIC|nr:Protein MODIFYING WALL LIGNIN-1 [Camellia lanceoleosa]